MQGRSLLPRDDADRAAPEEVFIQISESQVGRAIRTRRWKYAVIAPEADGWNDPGADEYVEDLLYDLDADPYELNNLIGLASHADVAAELRQRLLARMAEAGEKPPAARIRWRRSDAVRDGSGTPWRPGGRPAVDGHAVRELGETLAEQDQRDVALPLVEICSLQRVRQQDQSVDDLLVEPAGDLLLALQPPACSRSPL